MGIPQIDGENLTGIAIKLSVLIGRELAMTDMSGCYRVKSSNLTSNIFVIKLNDFAVKHEILKSKADKVIRVKDVISTACHDSDKFVYVNNHVTPFFGKLLATGRRAVKEKMIHSVWLSKDGCRFRLDANWREFVYHVDHALISDQKKSHERNRASKRMKPDDDDSMSNSERRVKT